MIGAHATAPAMTYALVHALWQGAAIALLAAIIMRRRAAAVRHLVGIVALVAMVAVSVATFFAYRSGPAEVAPVADMPGPVLVQGTAWLALIVPAIWLVGVAVVTARRVVDWHRVSAFGRAGAAPGPWVLRVDQLRRRLGIARSVAVRIHAGAPFTAHAGRPIVWLPPLWGELPAEQRDALAAHELAHVRRLDWIWNGLQCAVEAVLWFHPAAWWLGHRVRDDREHACDDLAIAACGDPIALVEALVALERGVGGRLAMAARGGGQLLDRTCRLVTDVRPPVRVPVGVVGLLGAGLVLAGHLALPRDMLLNLRVDASVAGPLTPGTYRDIRAEAFRSHQHYRASMDTAGYVRESYEVDGEPRPIDPAVRAWLDELVAIDAR